MRIYDIHIILLLIDLSLSVKFNLLFALGSKRRKFEIQYIKDKSD
jgi:hypothetical protein